MANRKEAAARLDGVFAALGDPTRRAVLERLARGAASGSELAQPFDMALPSFVKHLGVLEDCGLVRSHKEGRVRTCELAPRALALAQGWLETQRTLWEARSDAMASFAEELHRKETRATRQP
ncbi:MAG: metalloregulator ArsR/SmtB family transcription factor [Planctomycetota bacterium]|nr:metalloregulator ArsR/SmtB family transcription factor [Planctomycetota bacterium]